MIDVVITDYGPRVPGAWSTQPRTVAKVLTHEGYPVRSVIVIDAESGLTGTYRTEVGNE